MAQLTILGSSSGVSVANRGHASLWLQTKQFHILIDAGDGVSHSLVRANVPLPGLHAVFITHMHPDHCGGLPMLMYNLYLSGRTRELNIFLPLHGIETFQKFFPGVYIYPEKWPFRYSFFEIPPQTRLDDIQMIFMKNRHLEKIQALAQSYGIGTDAFSVLFRTSNDRKIIYSSDYRVVEDLAPVLDNCDVAIVECAHSPVRNVFQVAREAKVKQLIVNHIPPEVDTNRTEYEVLAASMGLKNVSFAFDGMKIEL